METLKIENFEEFVLSNEEMMNVRGGTGIMIAIDDNPTRPPIIIEI